MDMNNLNSLVLCYKYTISKLFYIVFMMNVINGFPVLLEYAKTQRTFNITFLRYEDFIFNKIGCWIFNSYEYTN